MTEARAMLLSANASRQRENLYYTSTAGHLFAATSVLFTRMRLPWYGMVSVSMDSDPIKVVSGGRTFVSQAIAIYSRDVTFIATPTRYISIVANPLHGNFRAFSRLDPPVLELDRQLLTPLEFLGNQAIAGTLSNEDARDLFDGVQSIVQPLLPSGSKLDERAQVLVHELWKNPDSSIDDLAARLGLSYHRTSHLFTEAVGIPVRTYQLWQKLYRSGAPLLEGASLTAAAHAAGFVDSAHYSTTFQKAYGRAPSEMFRSPRVTIHSTKPICEARAAPDPLDLPAP
jgi:AraC-like DNA-binding protein